ncbi:MAG: hypothetical protein K2M69_08515 [Muribaculaceae bacterium]|nr:hypothetical protein [Muribaculaceae bacterium]
MSKKFNVHISAVDGAKELRCGDYMDFYILPISDVELYVEDENGETVFDSTYQLCPEYSLCSYQEALENPDDEDNIDCVRDYKNTKFKTAQFFKTVWEKEPISEAEFCRQLVQEATSHDTEVEMELSVGDGDDQPLEVSFEIEVQRGSFDVEKLSFINFDMEEGDMECADIVDKAFTSCDSVLVNVIKYGDTFYQNCGDCDGFSEGCTVIETATVNCETLTTED